MQAASPALVLHPVMKICRETSCRVLKALVLILYCQMNVAVFAAPSVTRGPYLQQGAPQSMSVLWRTGSATDSRVRFGTDPLNLSNVVVSASAGTNHIVALQQLQPDTRYYYQIGYSGGWFVGDSNQNFVTSPLPGALKPTRLWVLGDSGEANADLMATRNSYLNFSGTRPADLMLMLGDNAYPSGTDSEYQRAVFNIFPTILKNTVLWPTRGNHDLNSAYLDIFTLPQKAEAGGVASGSELYYSFDYANIHFICLDSQTSNRGSNGPMCNWLKADLEATKQDWLIAFWHHPPYSNGSHDSDSETSLVEMRRNALPILESYGVDLVLSGHSHGYERSFFLQGHYGLSSTFNESMKVNPGNGRVDGDGAYIKQGHQGAVYTVAGNSSLSDRPDPHPAMYLSLDVVGSLVIDIATNRLDLILLGNSGVIADYFTLLKPLPVPPSPPDAPSNLVAAALSTSQIQLTWVDASTNEESFRLERSTNGLEFAEFAAPGPGATNQIDSGLLAETTYFYRARARNSVGDSSYSAVAQTTTFAPPPDVTSPGAVTNLMAINVSSNSLTLVWNAPGDDDKTGTAAAYDVRFSTTGAITDAEWESATSVPGAPLPQPAGNVQAFTLTGLTPATAYWFGLKTIDETNNISLLSNPAFALTLAVGTPASPTGLVAIAASTNEINLQWVDRADNEESFVIGRSTNGSNFLVLAAVAADTTNYVDMDVAPDTTYFYYVLAQNASADSGPSNVAQATTPPVTVPDTVPPARVTDLRATLVTSNSLRLLWTAPGDDGKTGTVARYELRTSGSPMVESNWLAGILLSPLPVPTLAGTTQSVNLQGLSGGTTYYFALKAADELDNFSLLSNLLLVNTAGLPAPWRNADIGSPSAKGSASHTNGVFTVLGAGSDIGEETDAFHFVYQPASGDCEIIARVTGVQNTSSSAKAGVMIRESLSSGSRFSMVALTPDKRIQWLRRTSTGDDASVTAVSGTFSPPQWLRVVRSGSTFTAYRSSNGTSWTSIGSKSISMSSSAFIGLGVTSRSSSRLNTSTFDQVKPTP